MSVVRYLGDLDECVKSSFLVAQLFAVVPRVRDEILWWRLTEVRGASPVSVSRKRLAVTGTIYATLSLLVARAEEEYEVVAGREQKRYRVKQVTYYAVDTDSCVTDDVEEIERLISGEAQCTKPLRTDITSFEVVQ